MYPSAQLSRLYKLLSVFIFVVILLCVYVLIHTIQQNKHSGELSVTTPNPDSLISISQNNKSAVFIGTGQAAVKLTPGTYLVGVARQGRLSTKIVHVSESSHSRISLSATTTPLLPSSAAIEFEGTDQLIARGMTTDQINAIRESLFTFNKNTKRAVVVAGSVTTPPYNPDSDSLLIGRLFTLSIDGKIYRAMTTWISLDTATLQLTDGSGVVVYDSASGHD